MFLIITKDWSREHDTLITNVTEISTYLIKQVMVAEEETIRCADDYLVAAVKVQGRLKVKALAFFISEEAIEKNDCFGEVLA